jgi:hypothetical protein
MTKKTRSYIVESLHTRKKVFKWIFNSLLIKSIGVFIFETFETMMS